MNKLKLDVMNYIFNEYTTEIGELKLSNYKEEYVDVLYVCNENGDIEIGDTMLIQYIESLEV